MTKSQVPETKTITNNQISNYRLRICLVIVIYLVIVIWSLVIVLYLELGRLIIDN
jgi:hypothetical protein